MLKLNAGRKEKQDSLMSMTDKMMAAAREQREQVYLIDKFY